MKKMMKRTVAAACVLAMVVSAAGCSKNKNSDGNGELQARKGGYVQSERTLPEEDMWIQSLQYMDDGVIRICGEKGVYESKDSGESWEELEIAAATFNTVMDSEDEYWLGELAFLSDNAIFYSYYSESSEDIVYMYIDKDGNEKEMNIELPERPQREQEEVVSSTAEDDEDEEYNDYIERNRIGEVKSAANGDLIGFNGENQIFQIDPDSGEIKHLYEASEDWIEQYAVIGNTLYIMEWGKLTQYNLESGKEETPDGPLNDFLGDEERGDNYLLSGDGETDTIYMSGTKGVYAYTPGSSELELLMDGSVTSLSNPQFQFNNFVALSKDRFLYTVYRHDDAVIAERMLYFEYQEDLKGPDQEISLYSLKEEDSLTQLAADFQEKHPDYKVNYEYAMDWENGVTLNDAINNLNTAILAGDGPDVLLLNGLPMNSYIEKGILADISDSLANAKKEDTFFDNIFAPYETGNGTFVVPTSVSVPFVMGTEADLENITDLDSLTAAAKEYRDADPELYSVIKAEAYYEQFMTYMFYLTSPDLMKEDGTLDETELKAYLEKTKQLYEINSNGSHEMSEEQADKEAEWEYNTDMDYLSGGFDVDVFDALHLANDKQKLSIGKISYLDQYNDVVSIAEDLEMSYKVFSANDKNVFIPGNLLGVNGKSSKTEAAKMFIEYALSKVNQSRDSWMTNGFPVNESAYDAICQKYFDEEEDVRGGHSVSTGDEEGNELNYEFDNRVATQEEYDQLKEYIKALDTPSELNTTIVKTVMTEGGKYMKNQTSLDDAVDGILKTVNLQLAE